MVIARFPSKEAEVFALAQEMMTGLAANAAVYPSPPVTVAELATAFSAYMTANNAAVAAQAAAEQATAAKDEALEALTDGMKATCATPRTRSTSTTTSSSSSVGAGARPGLHWRLPVRRARSKPRVRATAGFSWTGKSRSTAARTRRTGLSAASAPPARGRMQVWPSRAKSPSRIKSAETPRDRRF